MLHVVDPRAKPSQRHVVHFWQEAAPSTLCSALLAYSEYKGSRLQRVLPVDEPVTCQPCSKAIEMVARNQLRNLSAAGIEKVLDLVASMRNGDIVEEADDGH